jgi:2-methylisocitrate lyase-like PEP mutase family enzyme
MTPQENSADLFRRLHREGLLILPNAWDAGSARLIESRGAKAIATTSAGVAWSHGCEDGDRLPVGLLLATVAGVVAAVGLPVTVDLEGGYSDDPAQVAVTVGAVIDVGAVGINIEDGGTSPALLCAKLENIRRIARDRGVDLFVNARTDVYLRGLAPAESRVAEVLARAARYRSAGADGIFIPGLVDSSEIRAVAQASPLPVNVMAWPGLAAPAELASLGVRRLSAGAGIAAAVAARTASLASAFLRGGALDGTADEPLPYAEINALMRSGT